MKQKQVLDIQSGKGMSTSQSNEHLRNAKGGEALKKWNGNYDATREHLNFEIQKGGVICEVDKTTSIPTRIKRNIKSRGIKDPNACLEKPYYRTVANIILGGSREQMLRLAFGEQNVNLEPGADNSTIKRMPEIEAWALDMYKFMGDRFGEKNIAAFIVHLDELNPHVHCTLLPITEQKNRFSWRKVMVGDNNSKVEYSRRMKELHDAISLINAKYGLERGEKIAETGAKHRSLELYHRDLCKQLKNENAELAATISTNQDVIKEQKRTLHTLDRDIKHATARFKALSTMIANLEAHKKMLLEEVVKLQLDRDSGKIGVEEAQARLLKIQKELEEVDAKMADKNHKLSIAEQQLADLQDRTRTVGQKYEEVRGKLQKDVSQLNKATLQEMQAIGYVMIGSDTKRRVAQYEQLLQTLSFEQRQLARTVGDILIDGSIAESVAQKAAHVASIATALYLGYLDAATRISQSSGGGGGSVAEWGKRDDEDDLAFRQRCFFMAIHMMKPCQKRQLKR